MPGYFPLEQNVISVANNSRDGNYYVRVFDAPNPNFNAGPDAALPGSYFDGTHYYYESGIHTYTYAVGAPPSEFNFALQGGKKTTS